MRTPEERIISLHHKAKELYQQMEKRSLIGWGSVSGILFCTLLTMLIKWAGGAHIMVNGQMTGSSLLDSSMGGYVLVAVIAFSAGVILVTAIHWYRSRDGDRQEETDARQTGGVK